ncbi:hypothetical protein ACFC6L_30455 [Kitasatospora phosalacinea]|uniref:hypothetical protein n=1 Tax=Kitasatospora phosalacinea TaxID=2065 RepID=UPI0035DF2012
MEVDGRPASVADVHRTATWNYGRSTSVQVRGLVRQALGGRGDASVSDPVPDTPRPPLRVRTAVHERELPHLKHLKRLATTGLTRQALPARRAGFDDVLFLGRDGPRGLGPEHGVLGRGAVVLARRARPARRHRAVVAGRAARRRRAVPGPPAGLPAALLTAAWSHVPGDVL